MNDSKAVEIIEVGPRDGFQSVKDYIPTETKIAVVEGLIAAGLKHIQICSFVSPKAIPQMVDAKEVSKTLLAKYPELDLFCLIPNIKGAQTASELGFKKASYIVSLSETHNMTNVRKNHSESFAAFREIHAMFPQLDITLDLVTAFGCPFEGKFTDPSKAVDFLRPYVEEGIRSCCLCDTIGVADPIQVRNVLAAIQKAYPELILELHVHDTRGLGMLNAFTAIECGVTRIQTALGGLGGSPLIKGSSGNLSTEDLVWGLEQMGLNTGVDFAALLALAKKQASEISGKYSGHQITIEEN